MARFTVIGDIRRLKASAFLFTVAKECGLCETDSEAKTVKYVIGTGLEGRPIVGNFGPLANNYAETPVSWKERLVTAAELKAMAFGPVRYIVPRLVPEGVTLLIGRPKIGKSWLALDLAIATASGRSVLGSLKPVQGDVLYLALEDSRQRLKRRLDKLLSSAEWPTRLALVQMGDWPRADQGGLEDIAAWCKAAVAPNLVIIDTLERFRKPAVGRQQLYAADTEAIASLQPISIKYGVAILVLHHDRKAEADDPFDTVSGTLGLTGAADTILILKRRPDGGLVLHARGRDIEESDTALQFNKTSCRWTILGEAEIHRSAERARVIAALIEAKDGKAIRMVPRM